MARQPGRGSYDSECSIFVGNLSQSVTEELLWELFLQAGPLRAVHIPRHKETGEQRSFGFVEYKDDVSVPYACDLLDSILLCGRAIKCRPQGQGKADLSGFSPNTSFEEGQNRNSEQMSRGYTPYRSQQSPNGPMNSVLGNPPNHGLLQTPTYSAINSSTPVFFRSSSSPTIPQAVQVNTRLLQALYYQSPEERFGHAGPMRRTSSFTQQRMKQTSFPYRDQTERRHGRPY